MVGANGQHAQKRCLRWAASARLRRGRNEEEELATHGANLDRQRDWLGVSNIGVYFISSEAADR
jgi:hypothetical protein